MSDPVNIDIEIESPGVDIDVEVAAIDVELSDPDGAPVILVPGAGGTPGPPGPPLSAAEKQALIDEASEEAIEDLEPPVNLVLWFENHLV